jgi:hypothetical protein
MPQTQF